MTQDPASDRNPRQPRDISRHPGVWVGFVALLAAGVPWYLPASTNRFFLGLPLWVEICLVGNVALGLYSLWVIRRYWKTD